MLSLGRGDVRRVGRLFRERGLWQQARALLGREHGVIAAGADELAVRAALRDRAVLYDQDLIGGDDRRQAVSHDERGAATRETRERLLDLLLVLGVERGGRLVEHEDGGVFQQ